MPFINCFSYVTEISLMGSSQLQSTTARYTLHETVKSEDKLTVINHPFRSSEWMHTEGEIHEHFGDEGREIEPNRQTEPQARAVPLLYTGCTHRRERYH